MKLIYLFCLLTLLGAGCIQEADFLKTPMFKETPFQETWNVYSLEEKICVQALSTYSISDSLCRKPKSESFEDRTEMAKQLKKELEEKWANNRLMEDQNDQISNELNTTSTKD